NAVDVHHAELGDFRLHCEGQPQLLFCDNETNVRRLYGQTDATGFFKDAFHEYVVNGKKGAVNPQRTGTKAAALQQFSVAPKGSACLRVRLVAADVRRQSPSGNGDSKISASSPRRLQTFSDFDKVLEQRRREADEFYSELQKDISDPDARDVQ